MYQFNPLMEGKIGQAIAKQTLLSPREAKKVRRQAYKALKDLRTPRRYSIGRDILSPTNSLERSNNAREMQDFIYHHIKGDKRWKTTKHLTKMMGD